MNVKSAAWLSFFRLPNLPTAPGDALAGGAIALALSRGGVGSALEPESVLYLAAAGLSALLLYMFGLADNDITGVEADRIQSPNRPVAAGVIPESEARLARGVCLGLAIVVAALARLPGVWWGLATVLLGVILLYNRLKDRWPLAGLLGMGLCRGLSVWAGAAALQPVAPDLNILASPPVLLAVAGWTAYVGAVTWLAAGEHAAGAPLSGARFLPGLTVFIPLSALGAYPPDSRLLMGVCSICAYGIWLMAVAPLGRPHDPAARRRSVSAAIGAILYLQAGLMLTYPDVLMVAAVFALFLFHAWIRVRFAGVSGS